MARTRRLEIEIVGNDRSGSRMFGSVQKSASTFGQRMSRIGNTITGVVNAAFAVDRIVDWGMSLVTAAEESQKVTKQTEAVIASMGGAANVTADQVAKLSEQLSLKTGIDDELIQSGQNVLLTFRSVANQVGEGNQIFDRATVAALDMSVALGQDMQSSVIQVGKALNDPITGLTALRRVGIQFTAEQENLIKSLVESGDLLGAQKIILGELEAQFGGSAEAQATASEKLKVAFGNLQETLGEKLLPAVTAFSDWMIETGLPWIETRLIPAVSELAGWMRDNLVPAFEDIGVVLRDDVGPVLADFVSLLEDHPGLIRAAAIFATIAAAVGLVAAAVGKLGFLVTGVKWLGEALLAVVAALVVVGQHMLHTLAFPIIMIAAIGFGLFKLGQLLWSIFGETIKNAVGLGLAAFTGFWNLLVALISWVSNNWRHMAALIAGTITFAMAIASGAFRLFGGIAQATLGVVGGAAGFVARFVGAVFRSGLTIAMGAWHALRAVASGIAHAIAGLIGWLAGLIVGRFHWAVGAASGAFRGLWSAASSAFNAIASAVEWVIGKIAAVGSAISNIPGAGAVRGIIGGIFQRGGLVPGAATQAIPVIAHGKEMILNPGQQANLFNAIASGALGTGGGSATVVNVSFAGAIIASKEDARRWVTEALNEALRLDHRAVTVRGRALAT